MCAEIILSANKGLLRQWHGVWLWIFATRVLLTTFLINYTSPVVASVRPNVVAEVPGLDVGPLVSVTVAKGNTAWLPCRHPSYPDDTVSLVLWYLNHTSRPFLSYDAREKIDKDYAILDDNRKSSSRVLSGWGSNLNSRRRRRRRRFSDMDSERWRMLRDQLRHPGEDERSTSDSFFGVRFGAVGESANRVPTRRWRRESRMSLEGGGGTSLVIREVSLKDQAEYRCKVHFRLSPTWTQRLLLSVPDSVYDVELTDSTGIPLEGPTVGPMAEGDALSLACQANHGIAKVLSLHWLLEGVEVDTTWASAEKGVVINQLTISSLEQQHRNARLTCRLTTSDPNHSHIAANVTDASTVITMFYVPESKLIAEGGRRSSDGTGREVLEGKSVSFFCSVRADPPAYDITWLHNGRVVPLGGRRWRRDNTSLVISPVSKNDSGLYTCLASNSEGDGHSNAVHLKIAHTPYCSGNPQRKLVVTSNSTITLSCEMKAVPEDIIFTWMSTSPPLMPMPKGVSPEEGMNSGIGRVPVLSDAVDVLEDPTALDGGHRNIDSLAPIEVLPASSPLEDDGGSLTASWKDDSIPRGSLVPHRLDASSPEKSYVTMTPKAPVRVICYARNRVGRTLVPCTYTVDVVQPPGPLVGCNITGIGETRLDVKCDAHAHLRSSNALDDAAHIHHSPSLGFVRSPEASTRANLEVWSGASLLANVSNPRPEFKVKGLPPATPLKLVLYSATPNTKSTSIHMYARTLPTTNDSPTVSPPSPTDSKPKKKSKKHPKETGVMGGLGVAIGALVGGVGMSLFILVSVIMLMRRRQRRRMAEEISTDQLTEEESKDILVVDFPMVHSPGDVPHIILTSHIPPPSKLLLTRSYEMLNRGSNERLCRGSIESLRSCGDLRTVRLSRSIESIHRSQQRLHRNLRSLCHEMKKIENHCGLSPPYHEENP